MDKHTCGPWAVRIEHGIPCIRPADCMVKGHTAGYEPITKVCGDKRIGNDDANARLIAAAPELLVALRKLVALSDLSYTIHTASGSTLTHPHIDEAKAVIAKATGN